MNIQYSLLLINTFTSPSKNHARIYHSLPYFITPLLFALFSMSLHLSECHITLVFNGQHLFIITYIFTVLMSFTPPCTPLFLYGITFLHWKKSFKYFF